MQRLTRLPARFPANTKYVLEARGPWVYRYIEFPDGRRVELTPRKAATCHCAERAAALVTALIPHREVARRKRCAAA